MSIIEKITNALISKNYKELSMCFSPDAIYTDYAPAMQGKECYYMCGREMIEMFMRNRFARGGFEIDSIRVLNDETADWFASYDSPYMFVVGQVEATDENGLAAKFTVRPA